MKNLFVVLMMLIASTVVGQDTEPVFPKTLDTIPVHDPIETEPKIVDTVREGEWYVVQHDKPLIIFSIPEGYLSFSEDNSPTRPLRLKGIFAGGTGRPEVRALQAKYIYFVEAVREGKTNLVYFPQGVDDVSKVKFQPVSVEMFSPTPTPNPKPDPTPDPKPTPIVKPTKLSVLILYNENANRQILDAVNSTELVKWLTANCTKSSDGRAEFRRWDRTSVTRTGVPKETDLWRSTWDAIQPNITQDNMIFAITDTKPIQSAPLVDYATTISFLNKVKEGK